MQVAVQDNEIDIHIHPHIQITMRFGDHEFKSGDLIYESPNLGFSIDFRRISICTRQNKIYVTLEQMEGPDGEIVDDINGSLHQALTHMGVV